MSGFLIWLLSLCLFSVGADSRLLSFSPRLGDKNDLMYKNGELTPKSKWISKRFPQKNPESGASSVTDPKNGGPWSNKRDDLNGQSQ